MVRKRIVSFDLIRCLAMFCIITFHLMIAGKHIYPENYFFANYDIAQVGVSLFFILSGAALYYNDKEDFSIRKYFKRRFFAIFPMFWIAYISLFFYEFWVTKSIMPGVPFRNLIFSVIGMDGLLGYKFSCMYMTGEWFLGCIIILYMLYPVIRWGIKKAPWITFAIALLIYFVLFFNYSFEMQMIYNPFIRCVEFVFGVLYIELSKKVNSDEVSYPRLLLSGVLTFVLLFIPFPIPQIGDIIIWHIVMWEITFGGCAMFVFLMELGKYIKNEKVIWLLKTGSTYSYAAFLVHHTIAYMIQNHFAEGLSRRLETISVYIIYLLLVAFFAKLLFEVHKWIMTRKSRTKNG